MVFSSGWMKTQTFGNDVVDGHGRSHVESGLPPLPTTQIRALVMLELLSSYCKCCILNCGGTVVWWLAPRFWVRFPGQKPSRVEFACCGWFFSYSLFLPTVQLSCHIFVIMFLFLIQLHSLSSNITSCSFSKVFIIFAFCLTCGLCCSTVPAPLLVVCLVSSVSLQNTGYLEMQSTERTLYPHLYAYSGVEHESAFRQATWVSAAMVAGSL